MKIYCFKALTLFAYTDTCSNHYTNIIILAGTNRLYVFLIQRLQKFRTTGLRKVYH